MSQTERIIDFHSHILPCVDHGSDGIAMSREQIALLNNAGVDTVVLTPHFYPHTHTVERFLSDIRAAAEELTSGTDKTPRLLLGAEVLYCEGIEEMEELERLCIEGTDTLLLELPMTEWSKTLMYEVRRLSQKFKVVLAHIDRYAAVQEAELAYMLDGGAHAQINASALFHVRARKAIHPFVENGQISALGSDIHGTDRHSVAQLVRTEHLLGNEYAEIMKRASALLEGAIEYQKELF